MDVMKLNVSGMFIVILVFCVAADTLFYRQWNIPSQKTVTFEVKDTISISLFFEDKIPPDFLPGYTRFNVVVTDSVVQSIPNAVPLFRLWLDAGFLYFTHDLTITLPYSTGLLKGASCGLKNVGVYVDPYPVTKLHTWIPFDSTFHDTTGNMLTFKYHHEKYTKDTTVRNGPSKRRIASTGYPFEFGVFCTPQIAVKNERGVSNDYSGIRLYKESAMNYTIIINRKKLNHFSQLYVADLQGKILYSMTGNGGSQYTFGIPCSGAYYLFAELPDGKCIAKGITTLK